MLEMLTRPLDRLAIRMGTASVCGGSAGSPATAGQSSIEEPDFFCDDAAIPHDLAFINEKEFRFTSAISTPWDDNNLVHGKLLRCGPDWKERPSVILLHGWNGEWGYRWQFPWLAWRLTRAGINAAMLELPYHGRRKPRAAGAIRNFISHDLSRVAEAARQAEADTRALLAWLSAQGSPSVGLWGISLGAWLTGRIACSDARAGFSVLMSPVAQMDRAIAELEFCEPIRRGLQTARLPLDHLNLAARSPLCSPENVLLIESQHDLFAPVETIEHLWRAWGEPEIWRLPHGHISVLGSLPVLERTVKWIGRKVKAFEVQSCSRC